MNRFSIAIAWTVFAPLVLDVAPALFGTENTPPKDRAKTAVSDKTGAERYAWKKMFDGETLHGWSVPVYGGDGDVSVKDGGLVIGQGAMMTGAKYENYFPRIDYEIRFEAKRTAGSDFFAAVTFPVRDQCCTFINGGWGGGVVGLSCIDDMDASENETSDYFRFRDRVWYEFRLRVTGKRIDVWVTEPVKDGKRKESHLIDLETAEKEISLRYETSLYKPLGFCTWSSEGVLRKIAYRKLRPGEIEAKPDSQNPEPPQDADTLRKSWEKLWQNGDEP